MKQSELTNNKDYLKFLDEAKARISGAQVHAARSLNSGIMTLYWDLGDLIVEKQKRHGWGDSVVRQLAIDLSWDLHAGKSFSARNLWFMRQMFLEYSQTGISDAKVKQAVSLLSPSKMKHLVSQIPWGQNIQIMQKVKQPDARVWYIEATARYG